MSSSMILRPVMSEKAYQGSIESNTYIFNVPKSANKHDVARAVSSQFDVEIENVRIAIIKGKAKRSYKKGSRPIMGKRADRKRAYVRLAENSKISIFEEEEKSEKKSKKKADKEESK